MILNDLQNKGLINPPPFVMSNTMYLTLMGSMAYGTTTESSDIDIYGCVIPPKEQIFPHIAGKILGFGSKQDRFEQYQQHDIFDQSANSGKGKVYDFTIFGIVKYFQLCMENNPNCIDSLFTNQTCVLHCTKVGNIIRDNRKLFLHKGCYPKFKGYSYSQMHKMSSKNPEGKRKEIRDEHGFDTKYALHLVRLLDECEQILMYGDIDLMKNKEHLKAIRRGEVSEQDVKDWYSSKEKQLEELYVKSTLRDKPDENAIKDILLKCLEEHYGSLKGCIEQPDWSMTALREMDEVLNKYRSKIYG